MNEYDKHLLRWVLEKFPWMDAEAAYKTAEGLKANHKKQGFNTADYRKFHWQTTGWETASIKWADGNPVRRQAKMYSWANPNASDEEIARTIAAAEPMELKNTIEAVRETRWEEATFRYRTIKTEPI